MIIAKSQAIQNVRDDTGSIHRMACGGVQEEARVAVISDSHSVSFVSSLTAGLRGLAEGRLPLICLPVNLSRCMGSG